MEMKSYTGTDYRDIMKRIKRDYGDEAVIIKSGRQSHPAGPEYGWSYEVIVGEAESGGGLNLPEGVFTAGAPGGAAIAGSGGAQLQDEMQKLSRSIQGLNQQMSGSGPGTAWPALNDIARQLRQEEVSGDVIQDLLADLQLNAAPRELRSRRLMRDRGAGWIARRFKAAGTPSAPQGTPVKLAFIGPTGAGKTVSLIKLAANRDFFGGRRLGILSLDTTKIAATEQLRTFAGIVKAELKLVYREREIKPALRQLQNCEVILIDTPGVSWRSTSRMRQLEGMLELSAPMETHLVLPLSTKYSDLRRMVQEYRQVNFNRILLTKLDETATLGNLLNLACEVKPVFSFLGNGQSIPENIDSVHPLRIAEWLLDKRGFKVER